MGEVLWELHAQTLEHRRRMTATLLLLPFPQMKEIASSPYFQRMGIRTRSAFSKTTHLMRVKTEPQLSGRSPESSADLPLSPGLQGRFLALSPVTISVLSGSSTSSPKALHSKVIPDSSPTTYTHSSHIAGVDPPMPCFTGCLCKDP